MAARRQSSRRVAYATRPPFFAGQDQARTAANAVARSRARGGAGLSAGCRGHRPVRTADRLVELRVRAAHERGHARQGVAGDLGDLRVVKAGSKKGDASQIAAVADPGPGPLPRGRSASRSGCGEGLVRWSLRGARGPDGRGRHGTGGGVQSPRFTLGGPAAPGPPFAFTVRLVAEKLHTRKGARVLNCLR